jgi:hypothetical protein
MLLISVSHYKLQFGYIYHLSFYVIIQVKVYTSNGGVEI